jgi:hypothetical protein
MAVLCPEHIQSKLLTYCNWPSLPKELLTSSHGFASSPTAGDDALLEAFLQHLCSLVPFQWSVTQQRVFEGPSSSSSAKCTHAMMHAPAVGTHDGIMCFGGVQLGVLQEMKIENEVSWIKNTEPTGLAPDHSRVYQVSYCLGAGPQSISCNASAHAFQCHL